MFAYKLSWETQRSCWPEGCAGTVMKCDTQDRGREGAQSARAFSFLTWRVGSLLVASLGTQQMLLTWAELLCQ